MALIYFGKEPNSTHFRFKDYLELNDLFLDIWGGRGPKKIQFFRIRFWGTKFGGGIGKSPHQNYQIGGVLGWNLGVRGPNDPCHKKNKKNPTKIYNNWSKKFSYPEFVQTQKFLDPKLYGTQNSFRTKIFFGPKSFFGSKFLSAPKICLTQNELQWKRSLEGENRASVLEDFETGKGKGFT